MINCLNLFWHVFIWFKLCQNYQIDVLGICVVEEIQLDREPPLPTAFVPGFNDFYFPEKEDRQALILDLNGLLLCAILRKMNRFQSMSRNDRGRQVCDMERDYLSCLEGDNVFTLVHG